MAFLNFNAAQVEPQSTFDPIPAGNYIAQIIESELNDTKSGNGKRLNLQFQILDGEFKNRIIFEGLNVQNPNQQAEQIAQQQLSSICHAIGVLQVQDSTQLHNKPLMIKVRIRKDEQYGDRNEISQYGPLKTAPAAQAPATFTPPPVAASQPQTVVQPWNR